MDIDPNQDVGSYVERAKAAVANEVKLSPGYTIQWSGQYEYMQEANARLKLLVPDHAGNHLHPALPQHRLDNRDCDGAAGGAVLAGSLADLEEAVLHGAVKRVKPKLMTITAILAGLIPIMWSQGTGADVMKRIAAPMVGGVTTSALMELMVYPALHDLEVALGSQASAGGEAR